MDDDLNAHGASLIDKALHSLSAFSGVAFQRDCFASGLAPGLAPGSGPGSGDSNGREEDMHLKNRLSGFKSWPGHLPAVRVMREAKTSLWASVFSPGNWGKY